MARRSKPPISQWIVDERKRLEWKPADVSRRLKELGYEAEESTVQVWEAGRSPRAETIEGLEQIFGSQAPTSNDVGAVRDEAILAVTEAIREQTSVFREMLTLMREDRSRMIAPEALGVFLEMMNQEGLLAIPGIPASTDAPVRPSSEKRATELGSGSRARP